MRISPITINYSKTIKPNSHIQNRHTTSNRCSTELLLSAQIHPYHVNFMGYKENVEFLNNAESKLNSILNEVDFTIRNNVSDDKYYNALNTLKNDKNLYEKITSSSFVFNELEKGFNSFNKLILESIEDVRYNNKHFTQYWENNCKIGEEKIVDIINNCVNSTNVDINSILKKSNEADFAKIKEEITTKWFNYAYKNLEEKQKNNELDNNTKELEKCIGKEETERFIKNTKNSLTNNFNNNTKEKILSSNTTTEQKINALNYLLSFVEAKLLEDKGKNLEKDFCIINQVKQQLAFAREKESLSYAQDAIRSLHGLAFKKWEKDNLNNALNVKIDKEIFIKKEERKNPKLRYCQNYPNFNVDEKYFVARYFNTRYKTDSKYDYDKDDYLWQIINDRHNAVPARETVQEMIYAVKNNQDSYFEKLDSMYDLLEKRKDYPENYKLPERKVELPDDNLSFCDLYINKLGKYDKFKRKSESEKLDYLTKLTLSEITLLNTEVKNDWLKYIQPHAIIAEVNRQARNTSIFKKMFEELKSINENLTEIKIKTNDISLSLKEALTNSATFSNLVSEETPIKLSQQISDLQRTYNNLPTEAKEDIDEKLVQTIPEIQNAFSASKQDKELESTLKSLSIVKKEKNPTNKFLSMLQHLLIYRAMGGSIDSGTVATQTLLQNLHTTKNIVHSFADNINSQVFNDFAPMLSSFTPTDAISNAAPDIALASVAGNSGLLKSLYTTAAANPYVAVAVIATAISGGIIISGANKASKLEKCQRNLVFSIEI